MSFDQKACDKAAEKLMDDLKVIVESHAGYDILVGANRYLIDRDKYARSKCYKHDRLSDSDFVLSTAWLEGRPVMDVPRCHCPSCAAGGETPELTDYGTPLKPQRNRVFWQGEREQPLYPVTAKAEGRYVKATMSSHCVRCHKGICFGDQIVNESSFFYHAYWSHEACFDLDIHDRSAVRGKQESVA